MKPVTPEQLFAYTLSQVEEGWTWSLWDEDGGVVAAGAASDQRSAELSLFEALRKTHGPLPKDLAPAPQAPARTAPRRKHLQPLPARLASADARQHQRL